MDRLVPHGLKLLDAQNNDYEYSALNRAGITINPKFLKVPARQILDPGVTYLNATNHKAVVYATSIGVVRDGTSNLGASAALAINFVKDLW